MYFEYGAQIHRDLFYNALMLVHQPLIIANMPSAGRVNLLHQQDKNRFVYHLLYASPIQRGIARVIEDIVPLYNTKVDVHLPKKIKKIFTIPDKNEISFSENEGTIKIKVPKFEGHKAIVFEY